MNQKEKPFYGVWIVAAAWIAYLLCSSPHSYGSSVVLTKLVARHQWSEGLVGMAGTINYAFVALGSIPAGLVNHKYGYRAGIMLGSAIGAAAYVIMFLFSDNPIILMAMFAGTGLCTAMGALSSSVGVVNAWYDRNKALPMAILLTAGSVGGFLMPVIAQEVSEQSLRGCWLLYAAMMAAAFLIGCFVIKDHPEQIGEIRDGHAWNHRHPFPAKQIPGDAKGQKTPGQRHLQTKVLPVKACYHSGRFYSLVLQCFGGRAANAAVNSYIVLYAIHAGVSAMEAALLITVYSVVNFFGRLSSGVIIRPPMTEKMAQILGFVFMTGGSMALVYVESFFDMAWASGLLGLGFGMQVSLQPLLISRCFTDQNFPVINGTFNLLGTSGSAIAPMLVFLVAEAMGNYRYAFLVLGLFLLGCLLCAIVTPMEKLEEKEAAKGTYPGGRPDTGKKT